MDFVETSAERAFRAEVKEWLAANLPRPYDPDFYEWAAPAGERFRINLEWHRKLHAGGWVGLHWPPEYGGRGASEVERLIHEEETARARAPHGVNPIALKILGPTLMQVGTEEQKRRWLPRMLSAEDLWCQGFSEPGAGSDLGSLKTRAEPRRDEFLVTGQKVWISFAQFADYCWLLARSAPEGGSRDKYAGFSMVVVPMKQPGVTVRPLVQMTGDSSFCEVFFDGARVPRENLVGAEGDGWRVAIATLMNERVGLGLELRQEREIADLVDLARRTGRIEDPFVRQRLADLATRFQAAKLTALRYLSRRRRGAAPGPEGSIPKLASSELCLAIADAAQEILGEDALLEPGTPGAPDGGRWSRAVLVARYMTIAGGTSEVMRNILGERLLGLPKG